MAYPLWLPPPGGLPLPPFLPLPITLKPKSKDRSALVYLRRPPFPFFFAGWFVAMLLALLSGRVQRRLLSHGDGVFYKSGEPRRVRPLPAGLHLPSTAAMRRRS